MSEREASGCVSALVSGVYVRVWVREVGAEKER